MIPDELRSLPQWVVSGPDKVPVSPRTGRLASVTDPSTWSTYDEAVAAGYKNIGFVLTESDPFTFIDLDAPLTPEQAARHQQIYEATRSYAELSQSGAGVHIICRGRVPEGRKRDKVEVYSTARYMIMTGNVLRPVAIYDEQALLDVLFTEMSRNGAHSEVNLEEGDEKLTDQEIFDMALNAINGEKFDALCKGDLTGYPSQSEADYALMNILTFYTRNNEQVKRLFRYSALGKRDKAQREEYLDRMLRKIRAEQPVPIDFSALEGPSGPGNEGADDTDGDIHPGDHGVPAPNVPDASVTPQFSGGTTTPPPQKNDAPPATHSHQNLDYPPGFIGELARFIHDSSIRPVPDVSIAGALALGSGVVGRQFNISQTGLNLYIILLGKTGVGKDEAPKGILKLITATRQTVPMVDKFIGPGAFASGQAMVRVMDDKPCCISILGEFGLTLQTLSDVNANERATVMRRAMLDLYSRSGQGNMLLSSAYSDREKNTKTVISPALTLFGESTPESFYGGLSLSHVADGLIPRFLIIDYEGDRPNRNRQPLIDPPPYLLQRFADLVTTVLQMEHNNSWATVGLDDDARKLLNAFDEFCDEHIRAGGNEGMREIWNRAHLKALRLGAMLAAADRPHDPVMTYAEANWAINLVTRDCRSLAEKFEEGDVGEGEAKQTADLRRVLADFIERDLHSVQKYGVTAKMQKRRCVPHVYMQRRTAALAAFRKDKRGARMALQGAIDDLVKAGVLRKLQEKQSHDLFQSSQTFYHVGDLTAGAGE